MERSPLSASLKPLIINQSLTFNPRIFKPLLPFASSASFAATVLSIPPPEILRGCFLSPLYRSLSSPACPYQPMRLIYLHLPYNHPSLTKIAGKSLGGFICFVMACIALYTVPLYLSFIPMLTPIPYTYGNMPSASGAGYGL